MSVKHFSLKWCAGSRDWGGRVKQPRQASPPEVRVIPAVREFDLDMVVAVQTGPIARDSVFDMAANTHMHRNKSRQLQNTIT